jgi:hypothetical protein
MKASIGSSYPDGRELPPSKAGHVSETATSTTIGPDRRERPRRRPSYTESEVGALRIFRVFLHGEFLICDLSDRSTLYVPLRISPVVAASPLRTRYQWQIADEGRALMWTRGMVEERLRLPAMLAYPGAEISSPD